MEPPIKATLNKGYIPLNKGYLMHKAIQWQYIFESKEDNLYNGRNDLSQCVHYLEVPPYAYTEAAQLTGPQGSILTRQKHARVQQCLYYYYVHSVMPLAFS